MNEALQTTKIIWDLAGITKPLILASTSPRRADLLRCVGCPFEVVPPEFTEDRYNTWDDGELLLHRAVQKAESVRLNHPDNAVLAADTIVKLDERIFGKPQNSSDAVDMLRALSGRDHQVWTAMCYFPERALPQRTTLCSTEVTFRSLSDEEISTYIKTGEPLDKAGAYGIQGVGGLWIQSIRGCYFNVVGLPLSQLWDLVRAV